MKTLLLANGEANGGRAGKVVPRLLDFIAQRSSNFEYRHARSAEELCAAARAAAAAGVERVFVAGGDGTAHAAVNGLAGSDTALGIIPVGNGNDLAGALGLPRDPFQAAGFLLNAPVRRMDLVRAGDQVFAGVAGAGFDSATNRRSNAWPRWPRGHLRYWLAGFATMLTYEAERMEIVADGERIEGAFQWAAFANTMRYGGGLRIAPQADWSDGQMDICLIEAMSFTELLDLYPSLFDGRHTDSPRVRMLRAKQVELRAPAGMEVYGDGELLGVAPMRLRVEPGALRVLAAG